MPATAKAGFLDVDEPTRIQTRHQQQRSEPQDREQHREQQPQVHPGSQHRAPQQQYAQPPQQYAQQQQYARSYQAPATQAQPTQAQHPAPNAALPRATAMVAAPAPSAPSQQDVVDALSVVRRFAIQAELGHATRVLCQGVEEVLGCDNVQCLISDPLSGQPWALIDAAESIAGFAARERKQVAAQPAQSCPAYQPEVDTPRGTGSDNLLLQPIMAGGGVIAIIVAARSHQRPLFARREGELLSALADQCGPLLLHAVHTNAAQQAAQPANGGLFRGQALENHRSSRQDGAVLSLSPSWIRVVYPAVFTALAAGFCYGAFAKVDQYSTGPAVIRIEGTEVTARTGGTVLKTFAHAGQRVEKGDVIVQLHSDSEDAELSEIEQEYEQQMASFLFDPSNDEARSALASIKARKQKADKILDARAIRAPRAGVINDLRVRVGNRLEPGDYIMTIAEKDAMPTLIALLPGADRPRLKRGMTIQLKLPGYEKAHELATISEVGQEVIGPNEAARFVGDKIADALPVKGSVVIVRAKLGSRTFVARDKTFTYHDGMTARAEASVKSRRVIAALIPALEKWF